MNLKKLLEYGSYNFFFYHYNNLKRVEMLTDKLTTIYEQYISKYSDINLEEQFHHYCEKMNIENEIKILKKYLKQNNDVILKHELKCMKRVLRRFIILLIVIIIVVNKTWIYFFRRYN